ncbi:MAG TPA: hypothetical protein GXZ25_05895 [Peptococcaceae bacterium]|jgi:DNA-binding transcriptional MerR regulator|nr:hypothetical protein [Bacillota bacterium]HHU86325.1 hypothetical protein [Peptococcaceae bacterium]
MDQVYQLQRQIQDLRQEVNTISQVASQLQRSEANNAAQLQRLQQNENMAAQQLQAIQQLCNRLSQDVNVISNVAQSVTAQIANRPFTTGQYGTGISPQFSSGISPQFSTGISPQFSTGQFGYASNLQNQFGTFGSQFDQNRNDEFSRNQYISSMAANRYGLGFNTPQYASNQYISNLANQGVLGSQQSPGLGYGAATMGTGMGPSGYAEISTGNFAVQPAHPVQTTQYGSTSMMGSHYIPTYSVGQSANQLSSGLFGSHSYNAMNTPNIGRYSNF